jgi:hypothetical protein
MRSRYGGTLVVGLSGGDPDSLDPTVSRSGAAVAVYPEMCLRLYQSVRNHGTIEDTPLLAAKLPTLSKDKLTDTIQLRRGIEFNDGTPFNAPGRGNEPPASDEVPGVVPRKRLRRRQERQRGRALHGALAHEAARLDNRRQPLIHLLADCARHGRRELRGAPGVRRTVHVRPPGRRRQRHARQVALLVRA